MRAGPRRIPGLSATVASSGPRPPRYADHHVAADRPLDLAVFPRGLPASLPRGRASGDLPGAASLPRLCTQHPLPRSCPCWSPRPPAVAIETNGPACRPRPVPQWPRPTQRSRSKGHPTHTYMSTRNCRKEFTMRRQNGCRSTRGWRPEIRPLSIHARLSLCGCCSARDSRPPGTQVSQQPPNYRPVQARSTTPAFRPCSWSRSCRCPCPLAPLRARGSSRRSR